MFKQVVETAENAFDRAPQRHFVVPAVPDSLKGKGIYVVGNECAVRTRRMAEALADHASKYGLKSFLVGVLMLPHALQGASDANLAACNRNGRVEKIEIWELPVDAIVEDVNLVVPVSPRPGWILDGYGTL